MIAEEIAERHAVRPGFRLMDYLEVGLPVSVRIEAATVFE